MLAVGMRDLIQEYNSDAQTSILKAIIVALVRKFGEGGVVTLENMLYDGTPSYKGELGWNTVGDDVILYFKEEE